MSWYSDCKLVQNENGFTVEIYLNKEMPEFSEELITNVKKNILAFDKQIEKLVQQKFPDVKVNSVKLMLGALVVGSIPFMPHIKAHAAEITPTTETVSTYSAVSSLNTTGVVTAGRLNMRSGPSTGYSIMHVLWQGNRVKVIGESAGWYQIRLSDGRVGWVSSTYLRLEQTTREQKVATVINTAKSLLGTPYVWGGRSLADGGFDCSGFTQYVYGKAGITLNRISADQALQGTAVARANLQPGDLVFYSLAGDGRISHVGIYIGNGMMIHSPKTGDVVKTTDITTSFWESRFITARRVI